MLGITLTFTHSGFRWALSDGFVRENADPHFTFSLKVTVDRDTAGFNLAIGDPVAAEALQSELTEAHFSSTLGVTGPATSLGLTVLYSFGHQRHNKISFLN